MYDIFVEKFVSARKPTLKDAQYHLNWRIMRELFTVYIAENFSPTARALIGYFELTWHLTIKLFPAKSLWAGNSANSMTSEGNSALLPANVDRRSPLLLLLLFFFFLLYNKSLNDWPLGKQLILFPENLNVLPKAQPRETLRGTSHWVSITVYSTEYRVSDWSKTNAYMVMNCKRGYRVQYGSCYRNIAI